MSWVYILDCSYDDKWWPRQVYVGRTDNFAQRLKSHIAGKGAKFTKRRKVKSVMMVKEVSFEESKLQESYYIRKYKANRH